MVKQTLSVLSLMFSGLTFLIVIQASGEVVSPAYEPVGRGARIFVTKCYPAHGRLSDQDFQQLADAGFTVAVNMWKEDVPTYCRRAAKAGLDVMTWEIGIMTSENPLEQTVTRKGKNTRNRIPTDPVGWKILTEKLVAQAKLSLVHRNFKGANLDFEIYDRNKTDGFCESYDEGSFRRFLESLGRAAPEPMIPPAERYDYLKKMEIHGLYVDYQIKEVARQAKLLRKTIDTINPRFQFGVYGWGVLSDAVMENVATVKAPVLNLNAMTYGRTIYSNAFECGHDAGEPDRRGLKWSLTMNYQLACESRSRDYPVIYLGGHYPQSPGPGREQYKFTVRQAFNSAVYGEGYWIWTDWNAPSGWTNKQEWIDAMMAYFAKANAAIDRHDYTWANREPEQIPFAQGSTPCQIVTGNGKTAWVWDAISGKKLVQGNKPVLSSRSATVEGKTVQVNGRCVELLDAKTDRVIKSLPVGHGTSAVAVGDVDGVPGPEVITLNAGWVKTWDPATGAMLLQFPVGSDQKQLQVQTQE